MEKKIANERSREHRNLFMQASNTVVTMNTLVGGAIFSLLFQEGFSVYGVRKAMLTVAICGVLLGVFSSMLSQTAIAFEDVENP